MSIRPQTRPAAHRASQERGISVNVPERPLELRLLGAFEFKVRHRPVPIGRNGQRVLALLALRHGPVRRDVLARTLWPDVPESRLLPYLRSILWRLTNCCQAALAASGGELRLADDVAVDVRLSSNVACELIDRSATLPPARLSQAMRVNLSEDLMPAWVDEDWIAADRERFRQLRLHSLEALCERLSAMGWHGAAVDAALSSVSADPFRESARRALIVAYLAEGNLHQAIAEFTAYRHLLRSELRCEPSALLQKLVSMECLEEAIQHPTHQSERAVQRVQASPKRSHTVSRVVQTHQ